MSWVAVAIGGSALLGYGGSKNAANAQGDSTQAAIGEQSRQYDQNRADLAPYRSAGQSALQALLTRLGLGSGVSTDDPAFKNLYDQRIGSLDQAHQAKYGMSIYDPRADAGSREQQFAGIKQQVMDEVSKGAPKSQEYGSLLKPFTGADLQNEPGYQFGLTEGEKAINNLAATRGSYFSGGAAKDLAKYTQDYAGTKYNDAYNRDAADKTRTASLLSGVAGTGQAATNTGVSAGTSGTNAIADLMTQGGNAQASGIVGGTNAVNSGVGNYINWQNQSRMVDLLRGSSYGGLGANGAARQIG